MYSNSGFVEIEKADKLLPHGITPMNNFKKADVKIPEGK